MLFLTSAVLRSRSQSLSRPESGSIFFSLKPESESVGQSWSRFFSQVGVGVAEKFVFSAAQNCGVTDNFYRLESELELEPTFSAGAGVTEIRSTPQHCF